MVRNIRRVIKFSLALLLNILWLFYVSTVLFFARYFLPSKLCKRLQVWSTKKWTQHNCWVFSIKTEISGKVQPRCILTSNHWGYLDIFALGSVTPIKFVSRHEVKKWPLVGVISNLGGTIYINREKKDSITDTLKPLRENLESGISVLFFAEGKATDGIEVLPFKASLFQAAIETKSFIQPVYIEYLDHKKKFLSSELRNKVAWYGSTTSFVAHVWNFMALKGVYAYIYFGEPISFKNMQQETSSAIRKKIALQAREETLKLRKSFHEKHII